MNSITDLIPTFDALKPSLEADFIKSVTARCNKLIETYGDKISSLHSSWSADGYHYRALRTYIDGVYASRKGEPLEVNAERVAKHAKQYADDQIAAFTLKLTKKLGNLTNVQIKDLSINSFTFYITGELNGHQVSVEQNRIINVSKNGNLFHQWPARIHVDGKFTSEAAFKKLEA